MSVFDRDANLRMITHYNPNQPLNATALQHASKGNEGSWELNLQANKLFWSPQQYSIYGYEPNELSLNDEYFITNTTHPSDIDRITRIVNEALLKHEGYHFKRRIIKKDGSLGFVETEACIIRTKKGDATKIIGTTKAVISKQQKEDCDYNDPVFFETLYVKFKKAISYEIYKITLDDDLTKDLCQEVFLKAWHNMSKYDPAKGELYTWLINITRNHCKDYLRSKYFRQHQATQSFNQTPEELLDLKITGVEPLDIPELVCQLGVEQREVIELLFVQGYTQTEVAILKNLPLGTVKTRSRTALLNLRKFLSAATTESIAEPAFC